MKFDSLKVSFEENGYAIRRNFFKFEELNELKQKIHRFFETGSGFGSSIKVRSKKTTSFDDLIIKMREANPQKFGRLYDTAQTLPAITNIATSEKLVSLAASLLEADSQQLSWSGLLLRIDVPQDKRNTISWHQDHNYLPFNSSGSSGLVLTIPLQETTSDMGAVKIKEKSHKLGVILTSSIEKHKEGHSEQRLVSNETVKMYNEVVPELGLGDVMCMQMSTVHASGFNSSPKVRMSIVIRYHLNTHKEFIPFRTLYRITG